MVRLGRSVRQFLEITQLLLFPFTIHMLCELLLDLKM